MECEKRAEIWGRRGGLEAARTARGRRGQTEGRKAKGPEGPRRQDGGGINLRSILFYENAPRAASAGQAGWGF